MRTEQKIYCLYHRADMDGRCAGAIVKLTFPDAIMIGLDYSDDFKKKLRLLELGSLVYLVDFSFPTETMRFLNKHTDLWWYDHHDREIQRVRQAGVCPIGKQESSKAACELVWEALNPDKPVPLAVRLIADYDIWDHSDERVVPFNLRLMAENLDPVAWEDNRYFWRMLFGEIVQSGNEKLVKELCTEGRVLQRKQEQDDEEYAKAYAFDTWLQVPGYPDELSETAYPAIALNYGHGSSLTFKSVAGPQHTLLIAFVRLPKKKWKVSLRANILCEVDCAAIAAQFGGGGHKGAVSFECDELPFKI